MAKLIYVVNVSLDGYIEDAHGGFEWTAPTDEVFTFITGLVRRVGTFLYGRRLYETMAIWEADTLAAQSELRADFANVWQAAPAGSAPVDSLRRSKLGPRLGRPSSTSSPQPPLGCLTDGAGGTEGTMPELPTGTVTFVVTDLEGSTRLRELERGPGVRMKHGA